MAYRKGYNFHEHFVNTPGVYSKVKSDMRLKKYNGALNIAIMGPSLGGKPGEIIWLNDAQDARDILKGGDLLDACIKAYDPVRSTKVGVAIGGANSIAAIRTNSATKGVSSIYQNKNEEAKIGEVVSTQHPNSSGKLTATGTYTGTENATYKVVITSDGTNELSKCTYNYGLANEEAFISENDLALSETGNVTNKVIGEGVTITFGAGNYTKGDTFLIPCTAPVTTSEFVFTIESKDYGKTMNNIQHKVDDGAIEGTKKLTVYDTASDYFEIHDNMGGTFAIKYEGAQQYAALSITSNGKGDAIKLQTKIGANAEAAIVDLDISLNKEHFRTLKILAEHINSFENYKCEMVNTVNLELSVHDLDFVVDQNIKEEYNVTAVLRDFLKSTKYLSKYVQVNIINREVANFQNYPFTALTGGSEGKNATSYANFLDLISQFDIDYIVPLTEDMTIIAECRQHCIDMSGKAGKERRLVAGASNGVPAGFAVQRAKSIAHDRVQYVGTGFWDYDLEGELRLFPAYVAAAMVAGRAAFLKWESATSDVFNMVKPEFTYGEGIERKELIDNGVLFFDETVSDLNHKQFSAKLVWDYTTFTDYDDPLLVERSTGAIADHLVKTVRRELDAILTGKLTPTNVLESAKNRTLSVLKDYIKRGIILAYKDVAIKKVRDKTMIEFSVAPTQVNNFTFIDVKFVSEDILLD